MSSMKRSIVVRPTHDGNPDTFRIHRAINMPHLDINEIVTRALLSTYRQKGIHIVMEHDAVEPNTSR